MATKERKKQLLKAFLGCWPVKRSVILSQVVIVKLWLSLSNGMMLKILLFTMLVTAFGRRCRDFQVYPNGQCNTFVRCVGNYPVLMSCPINTMFNTFLKVCDWPYNVICTATTTTTPTTRKTTTRRPPITTTPYIPTGETPGETFACPANIAWGLFPDYKSNCKYYFECQFGQSRHIACPQGFVFNTIILTCDRPENSEC